MATRRALPWILWSVAVLCLLATIALVLWILLPRWAPYWVIANSPFVEPVLRAVASPPGLPRPDSNAGLEFEFIVRVRSWDDDALPALMSALNARDPDLRVAAVCGLANLRSGSPLAMLTPDQVARVAVLAMERHEPRLRFWALEVLRDQHTPAVGALRRAALNDPDEQVRFAALRGLDPGADAHDREPLLAGLADPRDGVRNFAAYKVRK